MWMRTELNHQSLKSLKDRFLAYTNFLDTYQGFDYWKIDSEVR